jgi:4-amino-4-deoxy-L-arabinose transferase-like glycosyltransferase
MQVNGKQIPWAAASAVLIGAGVLLATAALRGAEYDEGYTLLLAAGTPRPAWPAGIFTAAEARAVFAGHAGLADIARELRATDVHPPLYFWTVAVWRWLVGPSLFGVRLLSVLYGVLALALVGGVARLARIPPAGAILLTVGCYGFAYTGAIARDFALAQALSLAGVWLALRADVKQDSPPPLAGGGWGEGLVPGSHRSLVPRRPLPPPPSLKGRGRVFHVFHVFDVFLRPTPPVLLALAAGLCLGAATLSNYLAAFVAGAVLLWLLPRPRLWLAASADFALFLPAYLWFFLAQRTSRPGQFPAFSLIGSLPRLAQYTAANLFGGLPLYVPTGATTAVAAGLASIGVLLLALAALRWRRIAAPRPRRLLTLAALAPPVGLLLLGLACNSTPIELRYIAFATPFAALLLAGALASLPRRWCLGLGGALLAIQAVALLGLMTRQETMQPARAIAAAAATLAGSGGAAGGAAASGGAASGVVLLPRGNDGVGVVGAFVNEAPDQLRLSIAEQTDTIKQLHDRIAATNRIVLALIGVDAASRATSTLLRATFTADPCWRQAGIGFNVLAFDRICEGDGDVLRRLHADQGRGSGR